MLQRLQEVQNVPLLTLSRTYVACNKHDVPPENTSRYKTVIDLTPITRFSPTPVLAVFTPQSLVPDPQKLRARVPSDAYIINPILYLLIYGLIF